MPAVIQRSFTPEGAEFPVSQWARRVDDMFQGDMWEWTVERDLATVFDTYLLAAKQAAEFGKWAWPVIRQCEPAPDALPSAERKPEPVRGISPAEMASGDIGQRIRAAKVNRRVSQHRRNTSPSEAYESLEERHLD